MKTSTKLYSGLLGITLVAVSVVTASTASAYQGDPAVQGPDHSPERHEAMEQAFETNDYEAWKELMNGKGRVTQVVTADNFHRFAEAHALAENGQLDESKAIRAELGLGLKDGSGKGQGQGQGRRGNGQGR